MGLPRAEEPGPSLHDLPDTLTVEEAAAVLRVGRRLAYEQARRWRQTGGREGLPVVEIGRCLRVPKSALEDLLASARIVPAPPERPGVRRIESAPGARRHAR